MSATIARPSTSPARDRARGLARRVGPRARTTIKVGVSLILLSLLVVKAGPGRLAHSLARLDAGWVTVGLVAGIAAAVLQANQLRGLLVAFGVPIRLWPVLRVDTAGRLFDAALPTNIGGDVVRLALFGRQPGTRVGAAAAVLLRRVVSIPGLVVLIGLGCALSASKPYAGRAIVLGMSCVGGGALLIVVVATAGRLDWSALSWVPRPIRKVAGAVRQARDGASGPSRPLLRAGLRGLLFWATVVISQACYILAAGIHPPVGYAILVVTCVNAVSMLPISLGGYGLREGAFGLLLSAGGLGSSSQAASVGICLSVQTLLFGLVGGLLYLQLPVALRRPSVPAAGSLPGGGQNEEALLCPES